jgi:hypothetical protein
MLNLLVHHVTSRLQKVKTEAADSTETSEQTNCTRCRNPKYDRHLKNTSQEDLVSYTLAHVFVVFHRVRI